MDAFKKFIGTAVLACVIIVFIILLSGWTVSILWGWFVVPIFSLPPLNIASALGVVLTVRCIIKDSDTKKSDMTVVEQVLAPCFKSAFLLGMGWVILQFM